MNAWYLLKGAKHEMNVAEQQRHQKPHTVNTQLKTFMLQPVEPIITSPDRVFAAICPQRQKRIMISSKSSMHAKLVEEATLVNSRPARPCRSIRSELVKETDERNNHKERKMSLPSVIPSPSIHGSISGSNLQAASQQTEKIQRGHSPEISSVE